MPHVVAISNPREPSYPFARGGSTDQSLPSILVPIRLEDWSRPQSIEVQDGLAENGILLAADLFDSLGLRPGQASPLNFGIITATFENRGGIVVPKEPSIHPCKAIPYRMNAEYPAPVQAGTEIRMIEKIRPDLIVLSRAVFDLYFPRETQVDVRWLDEADTPKPGFRFTAADPQRCIPLKGVAALEG